eukprot:67853-Pyramimonas_sp.AAC.1
MGEGFAHSGRYDVLAARRGIRSHRFQRVPAAGPDGQRGGPRQIHRPRWGHWHDGRRSPGTHEAHGRRPRFFCRRSRRRHQRPRASQRK